MPPKQQQSASKAGAGGAQAASSKASPASATHSNDARPVAVIIADSFNEEMKPITNVRPRALMPVGNVPLIEYALELLVINGIKEVKIVAYFGTDKIEEHLATTVTYTGKTWLNSNEIKVELVRGSSGTQSLARALVDVLHLHQLPEHFILLPVDVITTTRNLSSIFATHVRRHRANPAMVFTAAVLESATPLIDTHRACVRKAIDNSVTSPVTAMSNASSTEFPQFAQDLAAALTTKTTTDQEYCTIAYEPQAGYQITAYQSWSHNERAVQLELAQLPSAEAHKAANCSVTIPLNSKSDTVVRTDLVNPGILVISQGFVSDVLQSEAMISDVNDFMRYFVDNPGFCQIVAAVDFLSDEPKGHFLPLDEAPAGGVVGASVRSAFATLAAGARSPLPEAFATPVISTVPSFRTPTHLLASSFRSVGGAPLANSDASPSYRVFARGGSTPLQPCVVLPVRTRESYISANIAVCERRAFPFTRESNFAEKNPTYAVWHHVPNVYVHATQPDRLSARMALGPNAILGADCHVARSASIAGSVIGDRVTIGEGALVLHSVVLSDAVIAAGAVIHNSIIGSKVQILANGFNVDACVVGDDVVVSAKAPINRWEPGTRVTAAAAKSDPAVVGPGGVGVKYTGHLRAGTSTALTTSLQLANLFTRDKSIKSVEDEVQLAPWQALYDIVLREMDRAVTSTASLETIAFTWKQAMLSYSLTLEDLLESITRAVITYVAPKEASPDDAKAAQRAVCAVLKRFCRPVFRTLIAPKNPDRTQHMFAILRGLSLALQSEEGEAVRDRAKFILSCLYGKADDELFERDGWCMVNFKSIMAFDDIVRNNVDDIAGNHDEALVLIGWESLQEYVDELRNQE